MSLSWFESDELFQNEWLIISEVYGHDHKTEAVTWSAMWMTFFLSSFANGYNFLEGLNQKIVQRDTKHAALEFKKFGSFVLIDVFISCVFTFFKPSWWAKKEPIP